MAWRDDGEVTTAAVAEGARRFERMLASAPRSPVILQSPNGAAFLAAWVGILRSRRVVALVDPTTPAGETERLAAGLGCGAILRTQDGQDLSLRTAALTEFSTDPVTLPEGTSCLKLTSGSTGRPRAIAASSDALLADLDQLATGMGLAPGDRLLAAIPMSFSYGMASLALPALLRDMTLVLPADDGPWAWLTAARTGRATVFPAVPTLLRALTRRDGATLPPSLRLTISAGAVLAPAVAQTFADRFDRLVHAFYGASECGGIAFDDTGEAALRGTVGRPLTGAGVTLDEGRVVVEGPAVSLGYAPASEASADLDGGRYRTSDRGEIVDGELRLLGRIGECATIAGRLVQPGEVEVVLRQAQGVDDVAVWVHTGRPEPELHALVASSDRTDQEMLHWCRQHLAPHKVPRQIRVVDVIPRNERGKFVPAG